MGQLYLSGSGSGYQVKRLNIIPGGILSLQRHFRRAEHWTVVSGTARITLDEKEFDLTVNESVFIPLKSTHRIANHGSEVFCKSLKFNVVTT